MAWGELPPFAASLRVVGSELVGPYPSCGGTGGGGHQIE